MPFEDYTKLSSLLKHCTVAVYRSGNVVGATPNERWVGAWNIARARLTQLGFLRPGSETGPAATIKHTNKGAGKSTKHSAEGEAKNRFFDSKIPILMANDEGSGETIDLDHLVAPNTGSNPDASADRAEVAAAINPHAAPRVVDLPNKQTKRQKTPTPKQQKNTSGQARKIKVLTARRARKVKRA